MLSGMSGFCMEQDTIQDQDTLSEFRYLYKNEPFPFDSGVGISDRQYSYSMRQREFSAINIEGTLKPTKVVVVREKIPAKKWPIIVLDVAVLAVGIFFGTQIKR